jgi:hypothetical protein
MTATTECFGKQAYVKRTMAEAIVKKWRKPVQIYRCAYCRNWHLGGNALGKAPSFKRNAYGVPFQ